MAAIAGPSSIHQGFRSFTISTPLDYLIAKLEATGQNRGGYNVSYGNPWSIEDVAGRTMLEVERTGSKASVPENHKAKLMYYFNCINCIVLDIDNSDAGNLRRLRDYENYLRLTADETNQLILLCALLSPDILIGKCIFHDEEMCEGSSNAFYKIKAVQSRVMVSSSIMIAGQNRSVNEVMFFEMSWLQDYYLEPIKYFADHLDAEKRRQERKKKTCVIS